jgi:hypothetical protein
VAAEKKLVVSKADENVVGYTKYTLPIIQSYAYSMGADFIILASDPPIMTDDNSPHLRIVFVKDLLSIYDRVAHIDADIVVNKNAPSIFDEVPKDCFGCVFEDVGSRTHKRRGVMNEMQSKFGFINGWESGFLNAGVFVCSKSHLGLFDKINGEYWTGWGGDTGHLSYTRAFHNFKTKSLDFRWNHMSMFSENWNGSPSRFDSYLIHYAGGGRFGDKGALTREQLIARDIRRIYGNKFFVA